MEEGTIMKASHRVTLVLDVDYSWHGALSDAKDVSGAIAGHLPPVLNDIMDRANVPYVVVDASSVRLRDPEPEPIKIWPPADYMDGPYQWHVVVDMRRSNNDANYEWSDVVVAKAKERGLDIEDDPETSCSYFYCRTEEDAQAVSELVRLTWAEGLP